MAAVLTPYERLRVWARVLLTRLLGVLPDAVAVSVHDRCVAHPGRVSDALVTVFRHRPIASLGSFALDGVPDVRLVAVDSQIIRRLYWLGARGYEPGETDLWRAACRGASGKIVEIGANVGYYTVLGAREVPETPYVTVEANPESADIVRRNVALNHLGNVEVVHAAAVADDSSTTLQLALPDQERYAAPTGAFLEQGTEGVAERRASSRSVTVPARGARSLLTGADLVKLDIEGAEHLVLEVTRELLLQQEAVLFVEVLGQTPVLRQQLIGMLEEGYEAYVLTESHHPRLHPAELETTNLLHRYGSMDIVIGPPRKVRSILSI